MRIYPQVPEGLVSDWAVSTERHDPGEKLRPHYHDVEEWLQVQQGEIRFSSAGGRDYPLGVGQALRIARGEVHRVEIGPHGVEYRMWIPVAVPEGAFANVLDDADLTLIQKNLEFPGAEDRGDAGFFEELLSERLMFRTARGDILRKADFKSRGFKNQDRSASDSVRVLHKGANSVLLSTIVSMSGDAGATQAFTNERLFVREGTSLKCVVWLNYPERS